MSVPPPSWHAEEDVDRIGEERREIGDLGVEGDERVVDSAGSDARTAAKMPA